MSGPAIVAEYRHRAVEANRLADAYERAMAAGIDVGSLELEPTTEARLEALGQELAVAEAARLAAEARADRFEVAAKQRQNEVLALRQVLAGIRRDADPEGLPGDYPADGTVLGIIGWWKPGGASNVIVPQGPHTIFARSAFESPQAAARQGFLPLWAPAG
jgi:hypothetical protein